MALNCAGQYKGDHIPGLTGLSSGTQAPPGLYIGDLVWVYPTSTVKDNNGDTINQRGSLTSTLDVVLISLVTDYKFLGANVGAQAAIPFIKNLLQLDSLDVDTGFGFSDMIVSPIVLGWHLKRADITAGYNLYLPTGRYSATGTGNTGLGMYGNEVTAGTTAYLDKERSWTAAATFGIEFHTQKEGTDITVGDMATIEGGVGKTLYKKTDGPIPIIMNVGVAGYSQFKVTSDSGSGIPPALRGFKDRVFGLGPEFNIFLPKPRLTLLARYEPEFGARNRTQGQVSRWRAPTLSLSTQTPEVVLGQPALLDLRVRNDSGRPVQVLRSDEGLQVTVTDPMGHLARTPRSRPPEVQFGIEIQPGGEESLVVAAIDLAAASIPGEYTVAVDLPELKASASLKILVKPWDTNAFSAWASEMTRGIIAHSQADAVEAAKALLSVQGGRSEPYACKLAIESQDVMAMAVTKLQEIGSNQAANCLIEALPSYEGIHKQFIESALHRIAQKTSDSNVRKRITLSLDSANK